MANAHLMTTGLRERGVAFAAAILAIVLATAGVAVSMAPQAQAAPVPTAYTATGSGDVLRVSSTVLGAPLANVDVVHSEAGVDSTDAATPATATSSNLGVRVGGLVGLTATNTETAPPSHTEDGTLLTASALGLSTGVVTYTDTVNWAGADACVAAGTPISSATTRTAGADLTLLNQQILATGVSSTTGTTSLVPTTATNDTRAVVATSTGFLTGLTLLNDLVTVSVLNSPSLVATATGTPTGSGVEFTPAEATVTVGGVTTTLVAGADTVLDLPDGLGSVTLHLTSGDELTNETVAADGTSASGDAVALTATISLLDPTGTPLLGSVDVDLLALHADATAPLGGVECADTTPPVIEITEPTDGSTTTDTTPSITGTSDVIDGEITLTIDDGDPITVPTDGDGNFTYTPTTPLDEGAHTVEASATDEAGNTATDQADFTIAPVDTTPPVIEITEPTDGSTTTDTTPTITGTSDVIDGEITLTIDDGDPITVPTDGDGNFTYTPTTPLDEGAHTVEASATDEAGNTATDQADFTIAPVDTTPPVIEITEPTDGSTTTDTTPTITGTSDVIDGEITLTIDDGDPITVPTDGDGNFTYTPTTPLDEGAHTVEASATDEAGNTATDQADFTIAPVDTTPPVIEITEPTDGSTTTDTTPTITGTSDVIDGEITLTIDDGDPVTVPTDGDGNFTYTPTTPLDEGAHTVEASATDEAGNTATDQADFTIAPVDTTPPVIEITEPTDGSTTTDTTPTITGTSDVIDGEITLTIDDGDPVTVPTDGDGNFTYTPTDELACGEHEVIATATDDGGSTSATVSFTLTCEDGSDPGTTPDDSTGGGAGDDNAMGDDGMGDDGAPTAGPGLAFTGASVLPQLVLATLLLLGGTGLLLTRRAAGGRRVRGAHRAVQEG
ncbi:Ig-like domain-containing protein [Janibacter terrae]|uniref:Ig-like domain-containing protein n=1 Tax=Janibacter terrae TaxID=103817 RepID=UPI0031F909EF